MLAAINFQDQTLLQADKIDDASPEGMLPPKPETLYLFTSYMSPQ